MLLPAIIRQIYVAIKSHLGPKARYLLLSDSCWFVDVGHPLWREDGSVICNYCLPRRCSDSVVQVPRDSWPFFHCLRLGILLTWRARSPYLYSPGTRGPVILPGTGFIFPSPPMTRGACGSVVVKALCYKPEGRGFDIRWGEFFNLPNPSGRTRPWGLLSLWQKWVLYSIETVLF
jgi:hypothetical protein